MLNHFSSSLQFVLLTAALAAGAGTGMHMLSQDGDGSSVTYSDCGAHKAAQDKKREDWGKIFDGLTA